MNKRCANSFKILGVVLTLAYTACKPENLQEGTQKEYFDLKGYFEQRIEQLKNHKKPITKTVVHNGASETKQVQITNWETELGMFAESDINKPAWKVSYTKLDSAGAVVYNAVDEDLKTRKIVIDKNAGGAIKHIYIYNEVSNALYRATEELNYFPDSIYTIKKYQKVKLLGANTYKITGKF